MVGEFVDLTWTRRFVEVFGASGSGKSSQYRGTRLALARDGDRAGLTPREVAFLDASVAAGDAVHDLARRRTSRLRRLAALMAVPPARGDHGRRLRVPGARRPSSAPSRWRARRSAKPAALRDTNPALSVQLGLTAYRLAPAADTRGGLLGAFVTPYADRFDDVRLAATSPTRDLVVGVDRGGPALWDVTDPGHPARRSTLDGTGATTAAAAFSPDGRTLATASPDRTTHLWNVADPGPALRDRAARRAPVGQLAGRLRPHRADAGHRVGHRVAPFSRDGEFLVTAGSQVTLGVMQVWRITDLDAPVPVDDITEERSSATSIAVSPTGDLVATGSSDGRIRFWTPIRTGWPSGCARPPTRGGPFASGTSISRTWRRTCRAGDPD